jgi:hypothetical protein
MAVFFGVIGCDAAGDATVATIVARDSAICTVYGQRIGQISTPSFDPGATKQSDLPAAAHYLDQVVPLMESELVDVKSAGRPNASQDLYASVLDSLTAVIQDEKAAQRAAHSGDLQAFRAAFGSDSRDATQLSGVAQQFGLSACAGS